jgi:hypothetical protein
MKKFLLILLLSLSPVLSAKAPVAHISGHASDCIERDSEGRRIQTCYLSVVRIDIHGEAILHNGFTKNFYPSTAGKFSFTLRPGLYRITLYAARTPSTPRWRKVAIVTPGIKLNLGEL